MTVGVAGSGSAASPQHGWPSATWAAAYVIATVAVTGCAGPLLLGPPTSSQTPSAATAPAVPAPGIVLPRLDSKDPASVAARFYTAWASTDAVHDAPGAELARCFALVTPALRRQLAASQPAPAAWQALKAEQLVTVIHVEAITHPAGAPPPTSTEMFLRVFAQRVTTTTAGRSASADGVTLQLVRRGHRWLVARLLFY